MLDPLVNLIYSSGSRFQQASTGNHGIKDKRNASLFQRIVHTLATVLILFIDMVKVGQLLAGRDTKRIKLDLMNGEGLLILFIDMVKVGQLLGRMRNAFTPDGILILVDCQLRRSGARVDDKYLHKV